MSSDGNTGVVANSVNPGIVNTEVIRHYQFFVRCLFKCIGLFFFKASIIRSEKNKRSRSQNCFRLLSQSLLSVLVSVRATCVSNMLN